MDGDSRGVQMHFFNADKDGGAECGIDTLRLSHKVIFVSCRNCIRTKRFTLAAKRALTRQRERMVRPIR